MNTEIRKFEISSDDDVLTAEMIASLPLVEKLMDEVRDGDELLEIEREDDEDGFYAAAFANGYDVVINSETEIVYLIREIN